MRKLSTTLVLLLTTTFFVGCSNTSPIEKEKSQQSVEQTTDVKSQSNNSELKRILWEHAGDLEAQNGYETNKGTAGLLAGKSGDYIITGGGANFPDEPVENGGSKKYYPDVYILKPEDGRLKQVNHTTLDYEIGYGSSITTDEGIYYVGGSPDEKEGDNVTLFSTDEKGELTIKPIGDLPFTFSDGIAVKKDNKIYVGLGKQNGEPSNKMYEFNIENGETKELEAIPGEKTRNQSVVQLLGDNIYVFSGGDKVAYTDGYKYDIAKNTWSKVSNVKIGDEEISLLGAGSVKLNDEEMLVIGGFNKTVYDYAVKTMAELKDEALAEFKNEYFGADPFELRWNKKILIYNATEDKWKSVGEVPFDAPCGEGLLLDGDKIYSINGEIKPGMRTNRTYVGTLIYK